MLDAMFDAILPTKTLVHYQNLGSRNSKKNVCVCLNFRQNAHLHAMCVRPKIQHAYVRVCDLKIRRNSQYEFKYIVINFLKFFQDYIYSIGYIY